MPQLAPTLGYLVFFMVLSTYLVLVVFLSKKSSTPVTSSSPRLVSKSLMF